MKKQGPCWPQMPEDAARTWAFVHRCIAAPIVEELVFRGIIQQLARPLGERQAVAFAKTSRLFNVCKSIPGHTLPVRLRSVPSTRPHTSA